MPSTPGYQPNLSALMRCIAAAFTLISPLATATCGSLQVTSCYDDGSAGTLRSIVTCADSGDTVDLKNLTTSSPGCSNGTITLGAGALQIAQSALILEGPEAPTAYPIISAGGKSRVIYHSGTGTLEVSRLQIANGNYSGTAASGTFYGGCIASQGYLSLSGATVKDCHLDASGGANAAGGGVWAATGGSLFGGGVITGNSVTANGKGTGIAGGIATNGPISLDHATVNNNMASTAFGGIVSTSTGMSYVTSSTISGNSASYFGGAAFSGSVTIGNSTISGNNSSIERGVLAAIGPSIQIYNSTIAFNSSGGSGAEGVAAYFGRTATAFSVTMQSTIISNNTAADGPSDLYFASGGSVSGSGNLIYAPYAQQGSTPPSGFGLPAGTCPLLSPLRDNGAYFHTFTHALQSGSPALTAGNNSKNLSEDERNLPRTSTGSFGLVFTDIGAYEVQRDDIVFNAGFDGCP